MITGVRLTQLANGEPLLGSAWHYKNLSGVDAVKTRLSDLFNITQDLGFEFIIDSIKPNLNIDGQLTLDNNGAYGDLWSFSERISMYKNLLEKTGLNIILEVDFPTFITDTNWKQYADYFLSLVEQYNWVQYWQVMITPEIKDNQGNYKCNPYNYVRFMKYIYPIIKMRYSGVKIGGPGIFEGLIDYAYRNPIEPTDWLSAAIGDVYKSGDTEYYEIGDKGFLPFVDFFTIQARQNIDNRLSYESFPQIIDNLTMDFKNKINKSLQIFSTYQGRAASESNPNSLNEQGYYELREILNCVKKNIIPFKTQLIDEYFDPNIQIDNDTYHLGLMRYFMGEESKKPALQEYKFLLNALRDFNKTVDSNQVVDNITDVDIITLMNTTEDKTATIIWPKHFETTSVVLQPHYARQYIVATGDNGAIVNPTQIVFNSNTNIHFVIVFQTVNRTIVNLAELEQKIENKLTHTEETLKHLISVLPNTYNKEVKDVNYYKLLRAFALELADAKIEIEKIGDNLYLDDAEGEAIYNNFGTLVNLSKKADWDYEKYRRLVKGVTQSLLNGPTPESVIDAVKLFTNFDVNMYELYKNYIHIDKGALGNVKPQYAFIIEIEKPIEAKAEQGSIYEDANYVVNIVKPAHTIHLVIVTLVGKENYREQYLKKYGIDFSKSDKNTIHANVSNTEGTFGWRCVNYDGQFKTANTEINEKFTTNNSLTNGGLFIGPRYILFDESTNLLEYNGSEQYEEVAEIIDSISIESFNKEKYDDVNDELHLSYKQDFIEPRFGLDYSTAFRNNLSLLNQFRLCPTTKLRDELWSELVRFLEEKYTFKSESLDYELEMFSTEVIDTEDFLEENDFGVDVCEVIPEYLDNVWSELIDSDSEIYNTKGITVEQEHIADLSDKYERDEKDEVPEVELSLTMEQYRTWTLTDSWYHMHKKITQTISTTVQNEYYLPGGDLYTSIGSNETSTAKVFVNGVLQPSFNYEEIKSFYAPNKVMGIKFHPEVLRSGDVISILYLWDQSLLVSNFPIMDVYKTEIMFSNSDIWKVVEEVNDELHVYTYYSDSKDFKSSIEEYFEKFFEYYINENYTGANDVPEFEGSPYLEDSNWNQSDLASTTAFMILNKSKLNIAQLGDTRQEETNVETYITENFDKMQEDEFYMELFKMVNGTKQVIQTS